jgi:Zn-dependent protease
MISPRLFHFCALSFRRLVFLFFASLLAHELSHSLVARAKGIEVEGITLFAFGGVSRTRTEVETPGDEFQILVSWHL